MCLSFCRQISVSLSCVSICCRVLSLSLYCQISASVSCVLVCRVSVTVCVDFLVAKLLRLHFTFYMILFDTCFALVRPALVVLFVSRLLFITIRTYFFHVGSFRVGKLFLHLFCVCLFWRVFVSFALVVRLFRVCFAFV